MKERKHIDRLFQEGFKDFEVVPSDKVWQNIEAKLNQNKKKRRVIPIWWQYAGIAALFLLLLTIGSLYFRGDYSVPSNQIVDTKNDSSTKSTTPNNSTDFNNTKKPNKTDNTGLVNTNDHKGVIDTKNQSQSTIVAGNHLDETSIKNKSNDTSTQKQVLENQPLFNEGNIVNAPEEKNIANHQEPKSIPDVNKTDKIINSAIMDSSVVAKINSEEKESLIINNDTNKNKMSIEEAISEAKNKEEDKTYNINKWSIATNAAPVYFNSLGKGSSLDAQFNDNSKSGEVNMSYGVSASYAINKKLSIRSGVNKVNLGYNTNNVVVFESIGINSAKNSIKNIDSNDSAGNISLISGENLGDFKNESFIKTSNTSINQTLGYIEIPLELQYNIIDKKFSFNVIGGFSSFFLSSNKLYSELKSERTLIGEATNLNKVSYSANFGLGLNYKITKKLGLNLEPLFKYQINAFNNTSGNFKPYFIGVYTGIGFKF